MLIFNILGLFHNFSAQIYKKILLISFYIVILHGETSKIVR